MRTKLPLLGLAATIGFSLLAAADGARAPQPPKPQSYAVSIDWDTEFQTIDNFGASDCWSMQKIGAWSEESKNRIADLLFSKDRGIALSCWRFNIGAGVNNQISNAWRTAETFEDSEGRYDWSRQANERWFLAAAKARGVPQFIAFVNSPPSRMTRNGSTFCSEEIGSTNLKEGFEPQFAKYVADILAHFRENPDKSQRIAFDWISPVNEPNWQWNENGQESCRSGNDDIKRVVLALNEELGRRSIPTRILIPESGRLYGLYGPKHWNEKCRGFYEGYLDEFCGDRAFLSKLKGRLGNTLCAHGYFCDTIPDRLLPERMRLREKLDQFPKWRYWQTEYCIMQGSENKGGGGRDLSIDTALEVARVIHYDLALCNASAWQWWTAVSPENYKDGLIYTDYRNPGDSETIYPSKTLWALGNFSKFVRPGAKRLRMDGAGQIDGLLGSAYKDHDAGTLTLVFLNLSESPAEVRFNMTGLPCRKTVRTFTPYTTSDAPGDDLKEQPQLTAAQTFVIPPRSIITLVGALERKHR